MKKPVKKTVDDAMHKAMQDKLITLAEKPLTPRSLLELEQMTRLVRQMIAIGQDPAAMKSAPLPGINPNIYQPDDTGVMMSGGVVSATSFNGAGAYAPSPPVENFGATIVRELMTLLGAVKKPVEHSNPADTLLDTIVQARLKGLDDVAETLTKQLVKMQTGEEALPMPLLAGPPSSEPKKPNTITNGAKA